MPGIFSRIFSYSFFNILNAVIPFLLLPFLTNSLGPEGYGIVAMFTIIVSFLIPITGLSVNSAITKQFYFLDEQEFISAIAPIY
jgi:O-antigen/teichoic acid export membrane protein